MKTYIFESKRLGFREWSMTDLEVFTRMNQKDEVMKYFLCPLSETESNAFLSRIIAHFDNHGYGLYAAVLKETREVIGFIGFQIATFNTDFTPCIEIGWRLDSEFWELGYATEGAKACLNYGFNTLQFQEVKSFTSSSNVPSQNVMKKIGLKFIKEFQHPKIIEGHPLKPHVLYGLKREFYSGDT